MAEFLAAYWLTGFVIGAWLISTYARSFIGYRDSPLELALGVLLMARVWPWVLLQWWHDDSDRWRR